jgi:hypothetical protein
MPSTPYLSALIRAEPICVNGRLFTLTPAASGGAHGFARQINYASAKLAPDCSLHCAQKMRRERNKHPRILAVAASFSDGKQRGDATHSLRWHIGHWRAEDVPSGAVIENRSIATTRNRPPRPVSNAPRDLGERRVFAELPALVRSGSIRDRIESSPVRRLRIESPRAEARRRHSPFSGELLCVES